MGENYSVLNNYSYKDKSFFISFLDLLSTPCRRILGGRSVSILSQTYDSKMSGTLKITVLFFSVLIFPVGIVSVASFAIKLATLPWFWEGKIVKDQTRITCRVF